MKRQLVKKVIANVLEFDMHNLFPPRTFLEELEEAASGSYEVQPRKTLRDRQYFPYSVSVKDAPPQQPLVMQPPYQGDFLKKLKKGDYTYQDFSMPSEMLQHVEEPYPRDLAPEVLNYSRPDSDVGMQVLKDWYDRGWDSEDSPEMSEDKILRMRKTQEPEKTYSLPIPQRVVKAYIYAHFEEYGPKENPEPSTVVAQYLMKVAPVDAVLNTRSTKVAKLLSDLMDETRITTKTKGTREPNFSGVTATIKRREPREGRFTFSTTSGKDVYTTIFQFIPKGIIRDPNKLHVRVNCSCPSFIFWGAQYNAIRQGYLYGKIRPKYSPPTKRDPTGRFLVCKHILKCIPILLTYDLEKIPLEKARKIQQEKKFQVEVTKPEKLKIPQNMINIGKRKKIKDIIKQWDDSNTRQRAKFLKRLSDPDEIFYFAHRFPETATALVAERIKEISESPLSPSWHRKKAKEILNKLNKMTGDEESGAPEIPPELFQVAKKWENRRDLSLILSEMGKFPEVRKKRIINKIMDPREIAYLAYKKWDDAETVSVVIDKLTEMANNGDKEADRWLKVITS